MVNFNPEKREINFQVEKKAIANSSESSKGKKTERLIIKEEKIKEISDNYFLTKEIFTSKENYHFAVRTTKPLMSRSWQVVDTNNGKIWVNINSVAKRLGVKREEAKEIIKQLPHMGLNDRSNEYYNKTERFDPISRTSIPTSKDTSVKVQNLLINFSYFLKGDKETISDLEQKLISGQIFPEKFYQEMPEMQKTWESLKKDPSIARQLNQLASDDENVTVI